MDGLVCFDRFKEAICMRASVERMLQALRYSSIIGLNDLLEYLSKVQNPEVGTSLEWCIEG